MQTHPRCIHTSQADYMYIYLIRLAWIRALIEQAPVSQDGDAASGKTAEDLKEELLGSGDVSPGRGQGEGVFLHIFCTFLIICPHEFGCYDVFIIWNTVYEFCCYSLMMLFGCNVKLLYYSYLIGAIFTLPVTISSSLKQLMGRHDCLH